MVLTRLERICGKVSDKTQDMHTKNDLLGNKVVVYQLMLFILNMRA